MTKKQLIKEKILSYCEEKGYNRTDERTASFIMLNIDYLFYVCLYAGLVLEHEHGDFVTGATIAYMKHI